MIVFKDGTTYYAQEADGTIVSSSTTDASVPINYAINNIPGAAARGWGGRVFIFAEDYDCKTTIGLDSTVTSYSAIELEGEGKGTRLNFTPSSALTDGIKLKSSRPRIANMRIYGNANVTNLIHILGHGTNPRVDYGILENLQIDGTPATTDTLAAGTPTSGQKGIYMQGDTATLATFFWKFLNLDFRGLDIGAHLFNAYSTSVSATNITSLNSDTAMKISGGQHQIANCYFQGEGTVGRYGIHVTGLEGTASGHMTRITNVIAELLKTGTECAAVLIEGNVTAPVYTSNVQNGYETLDPFLWHSVLDRSGSNTLKRFTAERYLKPPSLTKARLGWWSPGSEGFGRENGILRGNIVESPASTFLTAPSINGPLKAMVTTAAANNISSIYYNFHDGYALRNTSNFTRASNPRLWVRFFPGHITEIRLFIGLWGTFAAPTTSADILNGRVGVGLWLDTAVSANWKIMHNDGSGASTVSTLGAGVAVGQADLHTVEIRGDTATAKFQVTHAQSGTYTTSVVSTDIPTTQPLGFLISMETLAASQKQLNLYDMELEMLRQTGY